MNGHGAAGSLAEGCRAMLQIGLGVGLQSTLLLGLGLLAGRLLRRRGASLLSLLYQVTLLGTLTGASCLFVLGPHLQPPWSVSLPAVAPHPARRAALEGGPASLASGEAPAGGAAVIDPLRLPAIPAPSVRTDGLGSAAPRPSGREDGPATAGRAKGPARAWSARSGAPAGLLLGWLYPALVGVWATGAGLLLFRLLLCRLLLDRLRRRAAPLRSEPAQRLLVELSLALQVRPPLLLAGPGVHSPFLMGLRHPAILLPEEGERPFDGPTLRLILAHELVHLARRDCAWNLLARLAGALGWLQPLLWVLCRRLEQASEELCDLEVIRMEGDPRAYARCLFTLSEQLMPSLPARALGVGVVAIRSALGRRIQQILDSVRQRPLPPSPRLRAGITLVAALAVVLGLFLASAIAAPPGERDDPAKAVLREVRELDKRVTYTETKIPLGELVQKVAAETGAPLVAAPEVADEPVAVVVKAIPARELLEQLADLLDYQWHRRSGVVRSPYSVSDKGAPNVARSAYSVSDKGAPASDPAGYAIRNTHYARTPVFEIWQDLASKKREEALRNALRADVIRRFQDELHRQVEMAAWTPERLQKLVDDARRPTRADDPNANERGRRFPSALALTSPITRSVAQLLSHLSPEQWATVRDGKTLTLSTEPQPGELAMPAETERVLRATKPTVNPPGERVTYDDPNGPEQWRQIEEGLQEQWAAATGYRVTIEIDPYAWRTLNMLRLTAAAKPFRTGAPAGSDDSNTYSGTSVQIKTEASGDPLSWEEDKSQPSQAELAKDPVFGARQLFKPEVKPRHEWYEDSGAPAMFRLRDLLPDLARTYKVQFIADAYTPVYARMGAQRPAGPEALYQLLYRSANPTHRWDRRGNLIRLRSRTWFLDRPKEIPLRLVRHWKELTDQHGALPLDTYVEMVRSLNDLQIANLSNVGEDVELPQNARWFEIGRDRFALRLYAALSPEQQQVLQQGKNIPAAQMTPAQRELFLASLEERSRWEPTRMSLERWTEGRLSLEAVPRTLDVERPAASASAPRAGASPGSPSRVTAHYPVTRLTFDFWYAPDQEDAITFMVAAP